MHAFNQRILAEDLIRVRRPDDRERYAAAQRQEPIDPNPHQIDAVIFALRRLREGGCILADEVGLRKTTASGERASLAARRSVIKVLAPGALCGALPRNSRPQRARLMSASWWQSRPEAVGALVP